jgi:hypothetical protein
MKLIIRTFDQCNEKSMFLDLATIFEPKILVFAANKNHNKKRKSGMKSTEERKRKKDRETKHKRREKCY